MADESGYVIRCTAVRTAVSHNRSTWPTPSPLAEEDTVEEDTAPAVRFVSLSLAIGCAIIADM